ncbi:MAG: hypothetical protein H6626_02935 [Pseudobdellovibrionaceae bacterium]|nr:MAG: hypothetical protein H6626_02935 [Pseudobdellovibrionaceae bacterium]
MKIVKRILLGDNQASSVTQLTEKLRQDSCKVDASKVVNEILELFFKKYESTEFKTLREKFFDKKNYLKQLISHASSDEIDESIKQYLSQTRPVKKRGRKSKSSNIPINNEEAASS